MDDRTEGFDRQMQQMIPAVLGDVSIRYLQRDDTDAYIALEKDEVVKRYVGGANPKTDAELRGDINLYVASCHLLAVASTKTNQYLGRCGYLKTECQKEKEIYLVLASQSQKKGVGKIVVQFLMELVSVEGFAPIAYLHPRNEASIKLFSSLGWVHVGTATKNSYQKGHLKYTPSGSCF